MGRKIETLGYIKILYWRDFSEKSTLPMQAAQVWSLLKELDLTCCNSKEKKNHECRNKDWQSHMPQLKPGEAR